MTRNPPFNTEALGSVPGQGTKIPHALGHLSPCAATKTQHSPLPSAKKKGLPRRSPETPFPESSLLLAGCRGHPHPLHWPIHLVTAGLALMAPVFMPGQGRTRVYPNLCVPVGLVGLGSWLPGQRPRAAPQGCCCMDFTLSQD